MERQETAAYEEVRSNAHEQHTIRTVINNHAPKPTQQ